MKTQEELIRRARALQELANRGGTEAEALNAAEKLATMMAKYNLAQHEIDGEEVDVTVHVGRQDGKYNESWRRTIYGAAARMYMCNYLFSSRPGSKTASVIHQIIGESHNVAVAIEMGNYLEGAINRLANEAARGRRDFTPTERNQFIRTFRLTAAHRVSHRINEIIHALKTGKQVDAESGTTLPAMQNLYDLQEAAYNAWLKLQGPIRDHTSRDKITSHEGAVLGRAAGERIGLSTQIGNGSSSSKFALR